MPKGEELEIDSCGAPRVPEGTAAGQVYHT